MRLKIGIGINLAKPMHDRAEYDVHSQYCGTRRGFLFFQESPWSLKERQSGFTAGATRLDCPSL